MQYRKYYQDNCKINVTIRGRQYSYDKVELFTHEQNNHRFQLDITQSIMKTLWFILNKVNNLMTERDWLKAI